jgi:hypothetical protein
MVNTWWDKEIETIIILIVQVIDSLTRNEHVFRQMLTIERVRGRVQQVSNDRGTIHDFSRGR